jgi:hypothetical protein
MHKEIGFFLSYGDHPRDASDPLFSRTLVGGRKIRKEMPESTIFPPSSGYDRRRESGTRKGKSSRRVFDEDHRVRPREMPLRRKLLEREFFLVTPHHRKGPA